MTCRPSLPSAMTGLTLTTLATLTLAACGPADNASGPGGVTVGEAKALDEAAEMIEARRLPEGALPDPAGEDAPLPPQGESPPNSNEPQ